MPRPLSCHHRHTQIRVGLKARPGFRQLARHDRIDGVGRGSPRQRQNKNTVMDFIAQGLEGHDAVAFSEVRCLMLPVRHLFMVLLVPL